MICSKYARATTIGNHILIYNSLFGGVASFSNGINEYIKIQDNKILSIADNTPIDILKLLEKKHIISKNSGFDKELIDNKFILLNNKAKSGELIGSLRFTLTKDCNCSCRYCYVERNYNKATTLTFDDCKKFICKSLSLSNKKEIAVRFFGGEPTLEFDLIRRIVIFFKSEYPNVKVNYIINTNVQNINDSMLDFIKENKIKVVVSLDSIKSTNDYNRHSLVRKSYYDEAIKQIKMFVKRDISFVVGSVVTNTSKEYVPKFLEEMKNIGVKNIGLNFAKMVDKDILDFDKNLAKIFADAYIYGVKNSINISGYWFLPFKRLINGASHGYCGGLGYELDLRPDKKIYTCVGASKAIGDLESINEIPKNSIYSQIVNRMPPKINDCKGCSIEGLCAGECACDAKYATNNFFGRNKRVCDFQKEILKLLLEYSLN